MRRRLDPSRASVAFACWYSPTCIRRRPSPISGCFVKDQVDDLRRLGVDADGPRVRRTLPQTTVPGDGTPASPGAAPRSLRHRARPLRAVRRPRITAAADAGRDHVPRQRRLGAVGTQGVLAGRTTDAADRGRARGRRQPGHSRCADHPVRRGPGCVYAGRSRRGAAHAGLARGQALRALSRSPQRPLEGLEQARRRLRRDGRAAAPELARRVRRQPRRPPSRRRSPSR